jgi:hypothetical protein
MVEREWKSYMNLSPTFLLSVLEAAREPQQMRLEELERVQFNCSPIHCATKLGQESLKF